MRPQSGEDLAGVPPKDLPCRAREAQNAKGGRAVQGIPAVAHGSSWDNSARQRQSGSKCGGLGATPETEIERRVFWTRGATASTLGMAVAEEIRRLQATREAGIP